MEEDDDNGEDEILYAVTTAAISTVDSREAGNIRWNDRNVRVDYDTSP